MDINHIKLPATLITEWYSNALIESNEMANPPATGPARVIEDESSTWKVLGENKKNILVIVDNPDTVYLPDQHLQLLTSMLTACNLSLSDVAIINLRNQPSQNYKPIITEFISRVVLMFGIGPEQIDLPMNFPQFQIQAFAGASFLCSPSLDELENDKMLKCKLWVALRRLFNI